MITQHFAGKGVDKKELFKQAVKDSKRGLAVEYHEHAENDAFCIPPTSEQSSNWCWSANSEDA